MKKMLITILAIMFVGVVNVNAMTKEDLINKIKNTTVAGKEITLEETTINDITRYLEAVEATEADIIEISNQFDSVKAYLDKNPEELKDNKLSATANAKITTALSEISEKTGGRVKVVLTENNKVDLYVGEEVFASLDSNGVTSRETNGNYILVAVASVITLAGAAVLTKKIVETRA